MDFPEETKRLAEKMAQSLGKEGTVWDRAVALYNLFQDPQGPMKSYGYCEALEQGIGIRWPHEIKNSCECIEVATFVYAVAEALDLHPRMLSIPNYGGIASGHELVDVSYQDGRIVIDPMNSVFGEVTYAEDHLEVKSNPVTTETYLKISDMCEVPKSIIISRIQFYRTDQGRLNVLRAGQKDGLPGYANIYYYYEPKLQMFEMQIREVIPFDSYPYYISKKVYYRKGKPFKVEIDRGIFFSSEWRDPVQKEIISRQSWTCKEGHLVDEKHEIFPLTSKVAVFFLMNEVYEEMVSLDNYYRTGKHDPESHNFLFCKDKIELLYENLLDDYDGDCQADASSSQAIHNLNALKRSYFTYLMAHLHSSWETAEDIRLRNSLEDYAMFGLIVEMCAREEGISVYALLVRMVKRMGLGQDKGFNGIIKNRTILDFPIPSSAFDQCFPMEKIDAMMVYMYSKRLVK